MLWEVAKVKVIYWLGTAFLWMLPLNFIVLTTLKVFYRVPLGEQEVVGFSLAILGVVGATVSRRQHRAKRNNKRDRH